LHASIEARVVEFGNLGEHAKAAMSDLEEMITTMTRGGCG
jgi:hypothetical protein